ncbi:enoyl-CoA hydratase-related protein [Bradyrhizobium sp. BWA-3-5]|nr:enoyl-CoA hydratase-related protein [Bradyrhizobium sp. BWA-3-5]WOH63895.1 enoyl-CoA hydratase-related protein [Bradyrhizobium sp. BWA-3-5]
MSVRAVSYENHNGIGVVLISNPPVNAISPEVVSGLRKAIDTFEADTKAQALVIHCEGPTFVAGGDIASFESPDFDTRPFSSLLTQLDASSRPVVATLHGSVADWSWRWPATIGWLCPTRVWPCQKSSWVCFPVRRARSAFRAWLGYRSRSI